MVTKTNLFALPKFGSLLGCTASLKIGGILALSKKISEFVKLFVAFVLRFLVIYLSLIHTKLAPVRPRP